MPCRDFFDDNWQRDRTAALAEEVNTLEAMLCGVLRALESIPVKEDELPLYTQVLKRFDEKESGIDIGELIAWWREHQEKDRIRREKEMQARLFAERQEKLKSEALAKLSLEEKKALGLPTE